MEKHGFDLLVRLLEGAWSWIQRCCCRRDRCYGSLFELEHSLARIKLDLTRGCCDSILGIRFDFQVTWLE